MHVYKTGRFFTELADSLTYSTHNEYSEILKNTV